MLADLCRNHRLNRCEMNRWMVEKLKTARSEKGMSIVELIVGIIILLILLAGVLFFFDFGLGNFKLAQARGVLSQEADNVMEETIRQVRVATSFMVPCLLYTSDAADDLLCVDLGGRRIIKKKKKK